MNILGALTNAKKKMEKTLDDFNKALPMIKSLGFSIADFRTDMVPLPAIETTLRGSIESMDQSKIRHLIEGNSNNKVLVSILKALETASNIKGLIGELTVKGVEVHVKLGLLPKIGVRFIPEAQSTPDKIGLTTHEIGEQPGENADSAA